MRWRAREPRRAAFAVAALLALAGCRGGSPAPAASPHPTPSVTVTSATASPAAPEREYVIGVLGDWGVDDEPVRRVVAAMGGFNGGAPLDAVLTTGDNAYCCGTSRQSAFAKRVLGPLTSRGTPVYASLGNHDVATAGGTPFMEAFGMKHRWYKARVGPVEVVVLDANRTSDSSQLAFVREVVATPRPAPFRVVVFHQPGWSCSAHGPDDGVVSRWMPLFGDAVDLVLAGHNHTYERFEAKDGTPYVTTGGGGAKLYPSVRAACRGPLDVKFIKTVHHAVRLTATSRQLRVEAVDVHGAVFDKVTVTAR